MSTVGVVIIGRNEGDRLRRCLASSGRGRYPTVYVDSGSTDDSVATAREYGAKVVELDMRLSFTAARARNIGFERLLERHPKLEYVQFVDGDCELEANWLDTAKAFLSSDGEVAVVCGVLIERNAGESLYNRLCALEWQGPRGDVRSCGGIFMTRTDSFERAEGFNESLISGEEPELCLRLRRDGWRVHRLDAPMASHDAAMTRFSQWWKRAVRSGHAYAEAAARHGRSPERFGVKPSLSIWLWAAIVPIFLLATAIPTGGWSIVGFALYPILVAKIATSLRSRDWTAGDRWLYATFCVLAKWPQLQGQCRYVCNRLRGRRSVIIEYKHAGPSGETDHSTQAGKPRSLAGGHKSKQEPHAAKESSSP